MVVAVNAAQFLMQSRKAEEALAELREDALANGFVQTGHDEFTKIVDSDGNVVHSDGWKPNELGLLEEVDLSEIEERVIAQYAHLVEKEE